MRSAVRPVAASVAPHRCRSAPRPAGQNRVPTADDASVASEKAIAESPPPWRSDRSPRRPAPRLGWPATDGIEPGARAGHVAGPLLRNGTIPPDVGGKRAIAHGFRRVQCGDRTGKIVEEQPRHALIEEDLDGAGIAARERGQLAIRRRVVALAVGIESGLEIREQLIAARPSIRATSARPFPGARQACRMAAETAGPRVAARPPPFVSGGAIRSATSVSLEMSQTSEATATMPEPRSAGRSQLHTREGSDALPASFMIRASSRFCSSCAQRRPIVTRSFRQRPAHRARGQVFGDSRLEIGRQRVGVCGAQQIERRIGVVPPAHRRDLVLQTRERLAFLAIPIVSMGAHVSCTPCALRNRVNAYCRCPLTCISVNPVRAAISARVIPCT